MPFPRRRLIICLALCTLCLAGWVRSHYHVDTVFYSADWRRTGVGLASGSLAFYDIDFSSNIRGVIITDIYGPTDPVVSGFGFQGPRLREGYRADSQFRSLYPRLRRFDHASVGYFPYRKAPLAPAYELPPLPPGGRYSYSRQSPFRVATVDDGVSLSVAAIGSIVVVPFWFLTVLTLIPLLPPLLRLLRPGNPHACPACGYDLRATPDRCPECGRVASSGA